MMSFLKSLFGKSKSISEVSEGIWVVENLLTKEECKPLIQKIENIGFKTARQYDEGRHNKETFINEVDLSETLIQKFDSIRLKSSTDNQKIIQFSFPLEFYKYDEGDYIKRHSDAPREIQPNKMSSLTLVLYLNDDYTGGETFFPSEGITITPARGSGLLFKQELDHEALTVNSNKKYILRTNCLVEHL